MSEPNKIRVMADDAAARAAELTEEMANATSDVEKKRLRKHKANMRHIERWLRTRAGYE